MRARAPGVHDSLRNSLVIEVGDFLAEDEVLQQSWTAGAAFERVLVVRDRGALIGGQRLRKRSDGLVGFATFSDR
jgi:hypothetical protein